MNVHEISDSECCLQGHLIESVGWNWQNASDNTTGAILLGTSKGTEITLHFSFSQIFYCNCLFAVTNSRLVTNSCTDKSQFTGT